MYYIFNILLRHWVYKSTQRDIYIYNIFEINNSENFLKNFLNLSIKFHENFLIFPQIWEKSLRIPRFSRKYTQIFIYISALFPLHTHLISPRYEDISQIGYPRIGQVLSSRIRHSLNLLCRIVTTAILRPGAGIKHSFFVRAS